MRIPVARQNRPDRPRRTPGTGPALDLGRPGGLPVAPGRALVRGPDEREVEVELGPLVRVLEIQDLVEEVEEGAVGEHGDLVADGLVVPAWVVDDPRGLPALAAVRRTREHRRALEAEDELGMDDGADRNVQPIPDGVDEVGVEGVGRDRVLVVEELRVLVPDEGDRVAPGQPTVRGFAHQHGVLAEAGRAIRRRLDVEHEAEEVDVPVGRERDPGVSGPLEVPPVGRGAPGAERDLRDDDRGPVEAAVETHAGHVAPRPAVRPAVLLPAADEVQRVGRVRLDPRLDLAVEEDRAGLPRDIVRGAGGERAQAGDLLQRILDEGRGISPHYGERDSGDAEETGDDEKAAHGDPPFRTGPRRSSGRTILTLDLPLARCQDDHRRVVHPIGFKSSRSAGREASAASDSSSGEREGRVTVLAADIRP